MKHLKLITISFLFLLSLSGKGECAQQSQQALTVTLPMILEIEKVIVETSEYRRDEPLPNMRITESRNVDADNTMLRLTPVRVQIHTNAGSQITVSAMFRELKHSEGKFDFDPANLMVEPSSYTINNPYDMVISDIFIPYADVKPETVKGLYRGSLMFTLGAI